MQSPSTDLERTGCHGTMCLRRCPPHIVAVPWLLQQRSVLSLLALFYIRLTVSSKPLRHEVATVREPLGQGDWPARF